MANAEISTKPYLLRAIYEWCVDNGYTPHIAVRVDERAQVPVEYVKNGEITLNVSPSAVHKMQMGNDLIEFSARFGGVARQISVPVPNVYALYARETGHGMTFEVDAPSPLVTPAPGQAAAPRSLSTAGAAPVDEVEAASSDASEAAPQPTKPAPTGGRPALRRVK